MEVFVLLGEIAYEGVSLLGVFASEREAIDAHGVYVRDGDQGFDYFCIDRRVVGAPADYDYDGRMYI